MLTATLFQEKRVALKRGNEAMNKYRITRTDDLPDFLSNGYVQTITIECESVSMPLQSDIDSGKEKVAYFGGFAIELRPHDKIEMVE